MKVLLCQDKAGPSAELMSITPLISGLGRTNLRMQHEYGFKLILGRDGAGLIELDVGYEILM